MQFQPDVHAQFARFFRQPAIEELLYTLSKKMSEGHVCLPLDELKEALLKYGIEGKKAPQLLAASKKSSIVSYNSQAYEPFIVSQNLLYLHRYYKYEQNIIVKILQLINAGIQLLPDRIKILHENIPFFLAQFSTSTKQPDWQLAALIVAAVQPLSIITGGPGTGKTTTVRKVLEWAHYANPKVRVALAAPTGKAAMRMAESLQQVTFTNAEFGKFLQSLVPNTIHRLLGTRRNSLYFKHDENNLLPYDLIVVDECSMIDIALFSKLLSAIDERTQLILLGDKDQLAAVEAGSLFGDLCKLPVQLNTYSSEIIALLNTLLPDQKASWQTSTVKHPLAGLITELKYSHRFQQNQGIGQWSRAIIEGRSEAVDVMKWNTFEDVHISDALSMDDMEHSMQYWLKYTEESDPRKALQRFNQFRILCAQWQGKTGVHFYNNYIENWLSSQGKIQKSTGFYAHQPIMIKNNFPEWGLFNGDVGLIRYHQEQDRLMAFFIDANGVEKWILPAHLQNVQTTFAMTIHKSQGSEYNEVLVVLPQSVKTQLLTRELLYTAITRARKKVWVQASSEVLAMCVHKSVSRSSGIARHLNFLTS